MEKILTKAAIKEAVEQTYEECKDVKGGNNANYIPYLANIDSNLFGISLTLPDGTTYSVGDTEYQFGVESVSKVLTPSTRSSRYFWRTTIRRRRWSTPAPSPPARW